MNRESILTDVQYALRQLKAPMPPVPAEGAGRCVRAIDALERVEDAIKTDIADHPDPTPEDFQTEDEIEQARRMPGKE